MRPCAGSRCRSDARTGTDGGVRRLRLHAPIWAFAAFDLRRSSCLFAVAVFLAAGFWLGVPGAEGVGDALVGGVGLAVDAVLLAVPVRCASVCFEPVSEVTHRRPPAKGPAISLLTAFPAVDRTFKSCMYRSRGPAAERLGEQFIEFFGQLDGLMPSEPDE